MAAGLDLGKGATVLLKWAAAFWFQPVVLQDVEPVLTDLLIFQKKSKSRLLPKSLGPTQLWEEGLQGHMAKEKRAGVSRGLQGGRQQHHPASPPSAPGPEGQPAAKRGYGWGHATLPASAMYTAKLGQRFTQGPQAQVLTLWLGRSLYVCACAC